MGSNDIHSDLHNNLKILQKFVPAAQEFEDVFTEGMFRIPNKKGFDQVVYYLLHIINPKRVKQCICWPVIDAKEERQFRTAVVHFVSDINKEDSSAHIPHVVISSLQSPSGDIIAHFLRQISSYCLKTYLSVSCDFMGSSVLEPRYNVREKIILQGIKNLAKKLDSGNGEKKILFSQVLKTQHESKMLKVKIKWEKNQLMRVLTHAPAYVKQYWTQDPNNNILDWTKHLNKQTENLADIVLKLKSYHKRVEVLNVLLKGILERDHLNAECLDFTFSTNNQKDVHAAVFNPSGKLKLVNLVNWIDLTCKDLSHVLQENYEIDESTLQTDATQTNITNYCAILTNMEKQIDENHSLLHASVCSRKRKCKSSTCLFSTSRPLGLKLEKNTLIDIVDFYKDNEIKFLERVTDYIRSKKWDASLGEGIHSTKNKENFVSVKNYQEICENECEEKTVTEISDDCKLETHRKPSKIPIFSRRVETTKLFEQEKVNKTPSIKARNGTMNLPEVVTKTPPSAVTKDYMDLLVDTLYSQPRINKFDNLQNTGNVSSDQYGSNNINDSIGVVDNTTLSVLEDETFPNNLCEISAAGSSSEFVSSEFELSECDYLGRAHPIETEGPAETSPPPDKRKARPSIQALIDRYNAFKRKMPREDTENEH